MSAYQLAARNALGSLSGISFPSLKTWFWKWWVGLYAEPPRNLPPML